MARGYLKSIFLAKGGGCSGIFRIQGVPFVYKGGTKIFQGVETPCQAMGLRPLAKLCFDNVVICISISFYLVGVLSDLVHYTKYSVPANSY